MKIGFIGLGIMGEAMSLNIIKKHSDQVLVFDQVKDKMDLMVQAGATPCKNAMVLAQQADVIITMVPKSEHAMSVYQEILSTLDHTKICVDMSTIDPGVSRQINQMIQTTGAQFADAPVVKSRPAAEAGQLGIYVGCEKQLYERIKPILLYMGCNVIHMGENGKGLMMKICHNTLVAQIQNGVNETLCLAQKCLINLDDFVTAIGYGGGQNFYLDGKAAAIKNENYTVAFSVENMEKDLGICQTLSDQLKFPMPGMQVAQQVYKKAIKEGYGSEDFCATIKVVRKQEEKS